MDTNEQIFNLVQQWCYASDKAQSYEALRRIAKITGCTSDTPDRFGEEQAEAVMQWLQENYPTAYFWALGKHWAGHPATIWGLGGRTRGAIPRWMSDR